MTERAFTGASAGRQPFVVRPFVGTVVFRNVARIRTTQLWTPTVRPGRLSKGFPALYASLSLEVSLAERVKRTTVDAVELTVGEGAVALGMVADLTATQARQQVRVTLRGLTGTDYTVPQRIGARAYHAGLAGLLVPAAIRTVANQYPAIIMHVNNVRLRFRTPSSGVNLVVFPEHMRRGDSLHEILRYDCVVQGVRKVPG